MDKWLTIRPRSSIGGPFQIRLDRWPKGTPLTDYRRSVENWCQSIGLSAFDFKQDNFLDGTACVTFTLGTGQTFEAFILEA